MWGCVLFKLRTWRRIDPGSPPSPSTRPPSAGTRTRRRPLSKSEWDVVENEGMVRLEMAELGGMVDECGVCHVLDLKGGKC